MTGRHRAPDEPSFGSRNLKPKGPQTTPMDLPPRGQGITYDNTKGSAMDYRDSHWQAVQGTVEAIGVLQERLAMATEQCDVVLGSILSSVGSTEVDSAQNAMGMISHIKYQIDDLFNTSNIAKEEIERYGRGF